MYALYLYPMNKCHFEGTYLTFELARDKAELALRSQAWITEGGAMFLVTEPNNPVKVSIIDLEPEPLAAYWIEQHGEPGEDE